MAAQRHNAKGLKPELRFKIYAMLFEGAEQSVINAELKAMGCDRKLHGTTFLAIKRSPEYLKYSAEASDWQTKNAATTLKAAVIRANDADATAIAEADLLEKVQELITQVSAGGEGSKPMQGVKLLTSALKDLAAIKESRRITALEKQIETLKLEHAASIAGKDGEIVELKGRIAILEGTKTQGFSAETIEQAEEAMKIL